MSAGGVDLPFPFFSSVFFPLSLSFFLLVIVARPSVRLFFLFFFLLLSNPFAKKLDPFTYRCTPRHISTNILLSLSLSVSLCVESTAERGRI